MLMIEAAVILSALDRHWPDFFIIFTLLLANAIVGFWEEHQAGNAIAALKAKLAIKAQVKRDGKWINPAARGFRSLGVARADQNGQWRFLGVLPLFDPPREEAKATIATARTMGVKIKMVTGGISFRGSTALSRQRRSPTTRSSRYFL